jgi:serine/threonine protein kinase
MNTRALDHTLASHDAGEGASSDPVLELLVAWEEQRQQGKEPTPEQLCPHDPVLQAALRERIARRQRLLQVLDLPENVPVVAAAAAVPAQLPKLEGYEFESLVGQGGMGVVYQARQLGLNRTVAVKMILAGANASPQERARFRAEAEAVARLAHPNIVQIFEIGEQQGRPFLALEYVSGGSLAQQLDGLPVPPKRSAEMVLALAKGVQHAHERGVVHRDLKPANVLIHSDGTPKIADFGLAKRAEANYAHTLTGAIIGSPTYMAPEQAMGASHDVGPGTDIYALGVILYEMLTGRPPFKADSVIETIQQVREQEPLPPRLLQPKIPKDLETICLKCLEKKPEQRYSSAAALAADLQFYLRGEPIQAQSLTLLDQVARTISHHGFDERIRGFANRLLLFAPFPLTLHLLAFAVFWGSPYYPFAMVMTTFALLCVMMPLLIGLGTPSLRLIPTWQRKHFLTTWIAHLISMGVVLGAVLIAVPADRPQQILMVYSLWVIAAALSFLAHAAEAGVYYVIGGAMFVMSFVFALTPTWAPLEVVFLMTANMTFQGFYLRGRSTDNVVATATQERVAAASTVVPPTRNGS